MKARRSRGREAEADRTKQELPLEVVSAARDGDPRAQARVAEHAYREARYAFAVRGVPHEDSEDLTSEVAVRVQQHLTQLTDVSRFQGWLHKVIANLFADYVRHRRAEPPPVSLEELPAGSECLISSAASPEEVAIQGVLRRQARQLVGKLPPLYREAVECVAEEGMTSIEAARALGITCDAVEKRISRAIAMLRKLAGGSVVESVTRARRVSTDRCRRMRP